MTKANKPWQNLKKPINTKEWNNLNVDWGNEYKLTYTVESYLFRFVNYKKGLDNSHILKSTFGKKSIRDIEKEIAYWFLKCIGAYNEIDLNK